MKYQVPIFIFLIYLLQVFGLNREKIHEAVNKLLIECKEKESGSDEDFDNLIHEKFPETAAGNCMISCFFETVGFVS